MTRSSPLGRRAGSILALWAVGLVGLGCPAPTNPSEGPGTFEGLYLQGFEVSAFTPCGGGAPDAANGYWLSGSAAFHDRYNALATSRGSNGFGPVVYTRFTGTLSPQGRYGHLGVYRREVTVTHVMEMSVRADCPSGRSPS